MKRLVLFVFCALIACTLAHDVGSAAERDPATILSDLSVDLSELLNKLDRDTFRAAEALSHSGIGESEVRSVLSKLYSTNPAIVRCAFVNEKGVIVYTEPSGSKVAEGKNTIDQEQVRRLLKTSKPVFSSAFRTAEGIEAADLEQPVYQNDNLVGGVSVLFRPEVFASKAFDRASTQKGSEPWAIQPDGRIVFTRDTYDLGRNIFNDPAFKAYPDLIFLCRKISAERNGSGSFTFFVEEGTKQIRKTAVWGTVGLHGTEWRLVITSLAK